jgi:hypothetical protein
MTTDTERRIATLEGEVVALHALLGALIGSLSSDGRVNRITASDLLVDAETACRRRFPAAAESLERARRRLEQLPDD